MFRIPQKDKKFIVDNESMSRGNIYSAFNVLFDADKGKVKLNPPILDVLNTGDDGDFLEPHAIANFRKADDTLLSVALTFKAGDFCGLWDIAAGTKITGTNTPSTASYNQSGMCIYDVGAEGGQYLCISDTDGLHYSGATDIGWALNAEAAFKNRFILIPLTSTNRLYLLNASRVVSCDTALTVVTTGAYTLQQATFIGQIICAVASTNKIWISTSVTAFSGAPGECRIYEWDGISANVQNIYTIPTKKIQAITILNEAPVAIDERGRLWFFNGYNFELKDGVRIPYKEDSFYTLTCQVHRNGMISLKEKIYILVGSNSVSKNSSERGLSGIWCYDPAIGLYHFCSPDNVSMILRPYALAEGLTDSAFIAGTFTGLTSATGVDRVSVTEQLDILTGTTRVGFITTQFLESQNLTDMFTSIGVKYRKMIYTGATIEVKYRTWKNIECNTTITWTSATTFTATTASLDGTSTYCTPVAVGDEVMVQNGANSGLIAHITDRVDAGGTSTITIDRSATTTTGTAYAMFCNYKLIKTITNDGDTFKNIRLGIPATMIQVKLVLQWKGYYDELQEIIIPEKVYEQPV
jgi:hypothetical protein